MMVALVAWASAAVLVLVAPLLLTRGSWHVRWPRTALTAWFSAFFLGGVLLLIALTCTAVRAVQSTSADQFTAVAITLLAWAGFGAVGVGLSVAVSNASRVNQSQRYSILALAPVALSREDRGNFTLVRFESTEPVACAVPGSENEILLSTSLENALPVAEVRAILAHEYAHLHHRHGWAVAIARLNAACLPRFLPAGRKLNRATLRLIELAADDAAARQTGAVHLANALAHMSELTGEASLDLRAERIAMRRWRPARLCRMPEPIRI